MKPLTPERARGVLTAVWFASFLLNLGMIVYLYLGKWIEEDNFTRSITQISSTYVTYLGIVTAFYFGSRNRLEKTKSSGTPFALALSGSLLWNTLILVFMARVVLLLGPIEDSIKQITYLGATLSWLVAPAIGYYFASSSLGE
jgi:hypothetical protein